ncbi:ubiquitin-related domain-containing protein [Annulohypoxylon bovei var. microspora]|nr:ubiquitin-related domain-containing protein [Annulohypoxylon bovei var. microspora]
MPIFVRNLIGKTLTLKAQPSDSVDNVKSEIQALAGISPDQQRLHFAGKHLLDGSTLAEGGVSEESTLQLMSQILGGAGTIVCQREAGNVTITVRIAINHRTTVSAVKSDICRSLEQSLGVRPERVMLSYNGDDLSSIHTLRHYNIHYSATLNFSIGRS